MKKKLTIASIFEAAKAKGLKDVSIRIYDDLKFVLWVGDYDRMVEDNGRLQELLSMVEEHNDLSWMNR